MIFWENILKNALLGTERVQISDEIVPDDLQEHIAAADRSDPELYLLKVLTLASIYQKSGQCAVPALAEHFEPPATENLPYCSPYATDIWLKVKDLCPKHPYLLELFLQKIKEKQWIFAPDIIVDLLTMAFEKRGLQVRNLALDVAGKRGKWLLQFHPEWTDTREIDHEHIFLTGNINEKRLALIQIRRNNPVRGRELYLEHCDKESIFRRLRLAGALAVNFSAADRSIVAEFRNLYATDEPDDALFDRFQTSNEAESKIMSLKCIPYTVDWGKLPIRFNWSPAFSIYMLKQVYQSYKNFHFERGKMLLPLAAYLHPATNLQKIPDSGETVFKLRRWEEFCDDINPVLDCKRAMEII